MFYFVLGFGIGFYACYLTFKIKQTKKDKEIKNVSASVDKKVNDNKSKVENEKK